MDMWQRYPPHSEYAYQLARKTGICAAQGEYVGYVDGDDWIQPQMYEELLAEIVDTDADFVHFGFWEKSGVDTPVLIRICITDLSWIVRWSIIHHYDLQILICLSKDTVQTRIWSKLFRRDIICAAYEKVPDDLNVGEDLAALCFCIMEGRRIVIFPFRPGNDTVKKSSAKNGIP